MRTVTDRFREQLWALNFMRGSLIKWYAEEDAEDYVSTKKSLPYRENESKKSKIKGPPLARISIFMNIAAPSKEELRLYKRYWRKCFDKRFENNGTIGK